MGEQALSFMGLSGAQSGSGVMEVERSLTPEVKETFQRNQNSRGNRIGKVEKSNDLKLKLAVWKPSGADRMRLSRFSDKHRNDQEFARKTTLILILLVLQK